MRVARGQFVRVEPDSGLARLHQRVAVRQQLVEPLESLRGVEVQRDTLLAGVAHREEQAGAAGVARTAVQRREPTGAGAFGRLDLDDLGAEVTEQPGAELAAVDGQVNDAKTGQGSIHRLMVP